MAELQLPPSINDSRSQALARLAARLSQIDLVPLLVYRIDSVPPDALPLLAWQFDILSPLWQAVAPAVTSVDALTNIDELTDVDTLTEGTPGSMSAQKQAVVAAERALIKAAIQLHRYRGTPWVIKRALATLGWTRVSIVEGQSRWGGTQYPASQGWALFRVLVQLEEDSQLNADAVATATAAINFFKPARSWLDSLWFVEPVVVENIAIPIERLTLSGIVEYGLDVAPPPSEGAFSIWAVVGMPTDEMPQALPMHDGHYRYSGITYGANEPQVADPALILNGSPILHGG
jgi:P2-related tail formation protein